MDSGTEILKLIYDRFNERDIDGVVAVLANDVAWANGMDGGHVHGSEAVREYWTGQWTMVRPHVEPVSFAESADGSIVVEETHGRKDQTVGHVFRMQEGKVIRFDIRDDP